GSGLSRSRNRYTYRPMPLRSPPGPLSQRLAGMARAAQQPNVPSIQRRSTVLQLNAVIDVHSRLCTVAAWRLPTSACFPPNAITTPDPLWGRVERVRDLGRQGGRRQLRHRYAWPQRLQSMFVSTPTKHSDGRMPDTNDEAFAHHRVSPRQSYTGGRITGWPPVRRSSSW